jgi:hypothetical protein
MTDASNLPRRYRVTVRTPRGKEIAYQVVTWRSADTAIELAVAAHQRRQPEGGADSGVGDITVEDLGPVGQDQRGVLVLEGRDLVDRREF